ncbi:MarR family [Gaiella occulta]|uniref:MarR family n=1 Tax=Gaiella occulta TaxID=1002870 RepID=A0A7M2Z0U2_9ACTN|nr:MarR family transcriptional regulator [Gaiella occulta]RDI76046.1 MarR family [Gaiella occulta]
MAGAYTQSLLLYAYQGSARELTEALRERGHPAIRPKHGAVFANVEREGTRATTLAERAGIGKAAMGELIDELQALGYVERRPDPSDRRAKLVVPTARALEVSAIVHEVNRSLERRYRRALGREAYASLRSSLRLLAGRDERQPRI